MGTVLAALNSLAGVPPAATDQAVPGSEPKAYMSAALSAVRGHGSATGVVMPKNALRLPGLTADQV
jgi:hypothetical protein